MNEKTYVVKIKLDDCDNFADIEQAIYDMGATDVDILEVYDD